MSLGADCSWEFAESGSYQARLLVTVAVAYFDLENFALLGYKIWTTQGNW